MKRTALALILIGLTASPALAQGRGKNKQGIPPGHVPPDGLCRVWYEGVPPGRQPGPTSCYEAERMASRDRNARVIYGSASRQNAPVYRDDRRYPDDIYRDDDIYGRSEGRRPNPNERNRTGRAVPRGEQYPGSYPYPDARYPQQRGGDYGYQSEGFRRGYEDGLNKGREDMRDGDSFDPARHSWYRSADRGYNSRYGSRDEYKSEYRRGFLAAYESVHDGRQRNSSGWWPF